MTAPSQHPGQRARPVSGDPSLARVVLDAPALSRVISRMAHELLEKTAGSDLILMGIPTRGPVLAHRLAARMREVEPRDVAVGQLDITMYRDDLRLKKLRALEETEIPGDTVDGKLVVLVDDVLFSGRTIRAALDALSDFGRPRAVQLAVLVDRGHRELPIRADYVGKNVPTSLSETVHVQLTEVDGADAVLLGPADLGRGPSDRGSAA
jgi:pyrimidine operon attenuation protein/uracil phosphoribosyltransferase